MLVCVLGAGPKSSFKVLESTNESMMGSGGCNGAH